jgi:hypothetical protein
MVAQAEYSSVSPLPLPFFPSSVFYPNWSPLSSFFSRPKANLLHEAYLIKVLDFEF